jgi:hypothetical protein
MGKQVLAVQTIGFDTDLAPTVHKRTGKGIYDKLVD